MILNAHTVPHLTTASTQPLASLEKVMLEKQVLIETWFRGQWRATPAPITSSVDLRNAGFKVAPVDTNLFPAGFNNLNPDFHALCIQAAQNVINEYTPGCKKIILIPENHTRNPFYLESLAVLCDILIKAGFDTRIGSINPTLLSPLTLNTPNGKALTIYPLKHQNNQLSAEGFAPCLLLLNNDLSDGIPPQLENLEQWVRPTEKLGWTNRLKSAHFSFYHNIAEEFSGLLDIDPWLINPLFSHCDNIDFMKRNGEDTVAKSVDTLLHRIKEKYHQYGINEAPFVVIKADSGTYGMGVMMVQSGDELLSLNRKQRTKMAKSKGSQKISKVIIQEGVHSFESWQSDAAVAEPVVYMIGHHVVGGFYRVHKGRGVNENLNAPGMHFEPLAFATACNYPEDDECQNRFYAYGVIARLAALAAAREIKNIEAIS